MSTATLARPLSVDWPRIASPGAMGWFLSLGLLLRLVHFIWNHTIWYDEAVLLFNILDKDYVRLLGPLDHEQAAPPLYLWGLRTLLLAFGDHAYVWRFPSFLASCLTLLIMAALARRMLRREVATVVVGLVAFSDAFLWLGCNVKPYIIDGLLASCLIYAYVSTSEWKLERRLLLFLFLAPPLISTSYPMLFLYAAIMPAFLPAVWRSRRAGPWLAYAGLALVLVGTLAVLHFGPMHAQRVPHLYEYWKNKMPNLSRPASVPAWILGNTFLVFHYCYNPVGAVCVPLTALGVWWCLRHGRFDWACLGVGPVAACLLAAIAQTYPFSNNRLILFAAPGIGLMSGLGISYFVGMFRRPGLSLIVLGTLLIGPEIALCAYHVRTPWIYPDSSGATAIVRAQRQPGDVVASDEDAYCYFFFGELQRPSTVAQSAGSAGKRVWLLVDHATAAARREHARRLFPAHAWDLQSETLLLGSTVSLFVRSVGHEYVGR